MNGIEALVDARQMAAGGESGTIRFTADQDTTNQVAGEDYQGAVVEVRVAPLDEVLGTGSCVPASWKIDVENFEPAVLKGAVATLRRPEVQVVLLEGNDDEIKTAMRSHGFKPAIYDPFLQRLTTSITAGPSNNNLWVRDAELVQARCRESRKYDVFGLVV